MRPHKDTQASKEDTGSEMDRKVDSETGGAKGLNLNIENNEK